MPERGSTVFLCAHSQYRGVFMGLAERLKSDLGATIHLYTVTAQESAYYARTYADLFASITVSGALYSRCRETVADEAATIAEARRNEVELGVTINELAVSDRHLGRGFALGGFRHPRSRISEETSYLQMLNGFNAEIEFWRREIEEKRPDLLVQPGKVACLLARRGNIGVRLLAGSRYRNYYYWAVNEFFENPPIEEAYHKAQPSRELGLEAPYEAHLRFRARFRKEASFLRSMKAMSLIVLRHLYWRLRSYEKARSYYLGEEIAYFWRRFREIAQLTGGKHQYLKDLAGKKFVFFPLATEPETALQLLSPEYFFQLSAIASIARDLPAGVVLAVKEHYAAVGRRPADFYAQISELKNVRIINMAELGIEVTKQADVVVTISGTSGFEAAAMGKPVISFGHHNIYNFLPHVMVVTDPAQLSRYLRQALSADFDAKKAAIDGRRFLQAIVDVSFDLGDFSPTNPDKVSDRAVDAAYHALLRALGDRAETRGGPVAEVAQEVC